MMKYQSSCKYDLGWEGWSENMLIFKYIFNYILHSFDQLGLIKLKILKVCTNEVQCTNVWRGP